jgi:hypothetical protein
MGWHFGKKMTALPGRRSRWANVWLTHPCADLAYAFEVGQRVLAAQIAQEAGQ